MPLTHWSRSAVLHSSFGLMPGCTVSGHQDHPGALLTQQGSKAGPAARPPAACVGWPAARRQPWGAPQAGVVVHVRLLGRRAGSGARRARARLKQPACRRALQSRRPGRRGVGGGICGRRRGWRRRPLRGHHKQSALCGASAQARACATSRGGCSLPRRLHPPAHAGGKTCQLACMCIHRHEAQLFTCSGPLTMQSCGEAPDGARAAGVRGRAARGPGS